MHATVSPTQDQGQEKERMVHLLLELNGYVSRNDLHRLGYNSIRTNKAFKRLTEEFNGIKFVKISTGNTRGTNNTYSTVDFFGSTFNETYLVTDYEKFKLHVGKRLEQMFWDQNPNPNQYLRFSFMDFMKKNGLRMNGIVDPARVSNEEVERIISNIEKERGRVHSRDTFEKVIRMDTAKIPQVNIAQEVEMTEKGVSYYLSIIRRHR